MKQVWNVRSLARSLPLRYQLRSNQTDQILNYSVNTPPTSKTGNPILVLHGLFGSLNNWGSVGPKLARETNANKVVLADLRNHGKSFHHPDSTQNAFADDVSRLIDHLNFGNEYTIIGHSLGGKVVMNLALQHKLSDAAKLIIVDVAPIAYDTVKSFLPYVNGMKKLDITRECDHSTFQKELETLLPNVPAGLIAFLLTNLVRDHEHKCWKWRVNLDSIGKHLVQIGDVPQVPAGASTQQTTLFLGGEQSNYIPASSHSLIKDHFPNSQIKYIKGGHWLHHDNPTGFVEVVKEFLEKN